MKTTNLRDPSETPYQAKISTIKSLYKYLDFEGGAQSLGQKTLRFSNPKLFNDPFDLSFCFNPGITSSEFNKLYSRRFAQLICSDCRIPDVFSHRSDDIQKLRKDFVGTNPKEIESHMLNQTDDLSKSFARFFEGLRSLTTTFAEDLFVACFSETHDDLLLWSHYANQHSGIVIEYVTSPERDNIFCAAQKVSYQNDFPIVGDSRYWEENIFESLLEQERLFYESILIKSTHWAYENEYRIVLSDPKKKGENYIQSGLSSMDVKSVYFGLRADPVYESTLRQQLHIHYPHVNIYKAHLENKFFGLKFEES